MVLKKFRELYMRHNSHCNELFFLAYALAQDICYLAKYRDNLKRTYT